MHKILTCDIKIIIRRLTNDNMENCASDAQNNIPATEFGVNILKQSKMLSLQTKTSQHVKELVNHDIHNANKCLKN